MKSSLSEIINELEKLDTRMDTRPGSSNSSSGGSLGDGGGGCSGGGSDGDSLCNVGSLETRLLNQNKDMLKTIKKVTSEKVELKNMVARLEEELWNYKNKFKNEINTLTEHDREKVNYIIKYI